MIGDSVMLIVVAIWVKSLTGSNGAAGLTFFFMALPSLAAPVAGMFVDRAKRRTVLIWGNLASALAMAPLLLVHDARRVWVIYLVAVLYGISWAVLPAALSGLSSRCSRRASSWTPTRRLPRRRSPCACSDRLSELVGSSHPAPRRGRGDLPVPCPTRRRPCDRAASPWLAGFLLGAAILGFALPVFIVGLETLLQRRTPHRLMGRVSAAADVVLGTPQAASIALGALLITLVSYRSILWLSAAVIVLSAGYLFGALRRVVPLQPAEHLAAEAGASSAAVHPHVR